MTLGILNTIIALVVVLLVLSLLVQSVQTLIKKLLKLKSAHFKASLKDLYEQAIERSNTSVPSFWKRWIITLRNRIRGTKVEKSAAEKFSEDILNEFKNIGRVTFFGKPVLDSLSKADLLKVMGKLELERFFPEYVEKFNKLRQHITELRKIIESITSNKALRGAVNTNVAALRSVLAPIFNDVGSIVEGKTEASGEVKTKALFADLLRLKQLDIQQLLDLIEQAQKALTAERQTAANAGNAGLVNELDALSGRLNSATELIGGLAQKFDDAVMPLRNKREQVEIWFDTVTQSFDERYTRYMKTVSIVISIIIVILLNANFFRVYKNISTHEVQRNLIAESGPAVLEMAHKSLPTPSPSPSLSPSPTGATTSSRADSSSASGSPFPLPSPSPSPSVDVVAAIKETQKNIDELTRTYEGFGFTPLTWRDVYTSYKSLRHQTPVRNTNGDILNAAGNPIPPDCQDADKKGADIMSDNSCTPAWRAQTDEEWRIDRRSNVFTIFGWAIMTMLLSVGAPFWQDTLESLFGIKNLLRQKSGTQNVETPSGAGQPRE